MVTTTNMKMNNPNEVTTIWDNIYQLGKVVAPWGTVGYTLHLIINKVFRYFSDSRDAELRKLIEKEVQPKLDELNDKMDKIQKSIWELNKNK